MSPAQFSVQQQQQANHVHAKGDVNALCPSPLKINKDSHLIKKASQSPSPSASSTSSLPKPQQRHPVIIYTHSPKVIRTHPSDFMALVQKLTGLSRSDDPAPEPKPEPGSDTSSCSEQKNLKAGGVAAAANDDNESSSVVTEENCSSVGVGDVQVNSCCVPPVFDPPSPCFANFPVFTPNPTDFFCSNQPFYNYTDSLFFMPSMRSSLSSSTLEATKEFREF